MWAERVVLAAGLEQRVCPGVQESPSEAGPGLLDLLAEELVEVPAELLAEEGPGRRVLEQGAVAVVAVVAAVAATAAATAAAAAAVRQLPPRALVPAWLVAR